MIAKILQAHHANKSRGSEIPYAVGDKIMLSTVNRQCDYMQKRDGRVAKFMPRQDSPYTVLEAFLKSSEYVLELPQRMGVINCFHASLLSPFNPNDDELFPSRHLKMPGPIVMEEMDSLSTL